MLTLESDLNRLSLSNLCYNPSLILKSILGFMVFSRDSHEITVL